jgi:4-amino-4-deoxy-L-arabinose transferase-like glycosyltransferase
MRWLDLIWLLLFGIASSVWCLTAAPHLGATFDEPFYIKAGLTSWRTGSNKLLMRAGTMTLPVDVQTLPIYLWEQFRKQPFDPEAELHTVLPIARATNLIFWWLLLTYCFRLGRTFGGSWGGRLAVALCACDPNLLAHATLATTDIAIVACVLILVYHFWHGQGQDWYRRVLIPGLCYGLAIQAKASGLVFGFEAMVVLGLWQLGESGMLRSTVPSSIFGQLRHIWHVTYQLRKDLLWITAIGLTFVFAYTGCDWGTEPTFIQWANQLPEGQLKKVMLPVSHHLTIFTNAGEGLLYQIKHNVRGHGTYFLGEWYPRATRLYFPAALTMKVPISVFVLLLAILLMHPRQLIGPIGAIAMLLLVLSPNYRVQIGIRFMFTMVVLGYVALAVAVARGWAASESRSLPRWFVAGIVGSMAATSVWVWPHGLAYFNQLWGGPSNGQYLLHDSNTDWGQGLPELRKWSAQQGNTTVAVWYYGTDPAVYQAPLQRAFLSHLPHQGTKKEIQQLCGNAKYLAVSLGCLHGNDRVTQSHQLALDWVRTQQPIDRTRFFLIYQLK